jgi:hypothetical protein
MQSRQHLRKDQSLSSLCYRSSFQSHTCPSVAALCVAFPNDLPAVPMGRNVAGSRNPLVFIWSQQWLPRSTGLAAPGSERLSGHPMPQGNQENESLR